MSNVALIDETTTPANGNEPSVMPPASAGESPQGRWSMRSRLVLAASVLVAGMLVQYGLLLYVRAGGIPPAANLVSPLKTLPLEIGRWRGEDVEITDRNALYGNEHLKRKYVNRDTRQEVLIWMVYSRVGVDRDHHPEICYAVRDQHEIATQRRQLNVDALNNAKAGAETGAEAAGAPVEVFCFGDEKQAQFVYYWNYTLPTPENEGHDTLRRAYHRMRTRPASVTAEVFAGQQPGKRTGEVDSLVAQLDLALQKIVGEEARRSSERKPFTILKTDTQPQQE